MTPLLTVPNLVAWGVQTTLIVGSALLAMRLVRLDAPSVHYLVLRALLALCLLLPLLQALLPVPAGSNAHTAAVAVASLTAASETTGAAASLDLLERPANRNALLAILLLGILARLVWIGAGTLRLRRLRQLGAPAASDTHDELQQLLGTRAEIRYVARLGQPVTFGFRHPVVLLPETLLACPAAMQRAVLTHELWHVRRHDWMWTVGEEWLRAFLWFHPAVWLLLSRIQAAREEVVDELTVLAIGSRRSYVDALLFYAGEAPLVATMAFARRRHLVHRMILISKEAVMSARRIVASGAVVAAVALGAAWYGAQAFPLAQEVPSADFDRIGPLESQSRPITPENPIPRRTGFVAAAYPADAEAIGLRGSVVVRLTLDQAGNVAEARPVSLAFRHGSEGSLHAFSGQLGELRAAIASWGASADGTAVTSALDAILREAVSAVRRWSYEPPADAPISFNVGVPFGAAGGTIVPPPPPPPPPPAPPQLSDGRPLDHGAIRVGGSIDPPRKIWNVNPIYPAEAKEAKVQGVVIVEARIEPDGTVGDARVLRSVPMLDEAALEAVRQWQFAPTYLNGEPVPVVMTVTINFTLAE